MCILTATWALYLRNACYLGRERIKGGEHGNSRGTQKEHSVTLPNPTSYLPVLNTRRIDRS